MSFDRHLNDKGKNYPHTRKKGIENKIPDILSQAETVVNDFITRPKKRKNKPKAVFLSLYLSLSVLALGVYLFLILK